MNSQKLLDEVPIISLDSFEFSKEVLIKNILVKTLEGKDKIVNPHKHSFFMFVLFTEAKGIHNIDFEDYAIKDYEIHVLYPGQVHSWDIKSNKVAYCRDVLYLY